MKKSDLVRIDHKGTVIDGGDCRLINRAAVMIHAAGKCFFWPLVEQVCGRSALFENEKN